MRITENCVINNMPDSVYHSDPCAEPSLSSSMASALLEKTEQEAFLSSKRLNPNYVDSSSDSMDLGTICHDMVLKGGISTFEILDFDSWRTKEARAARDEVLAAGKIPLNQSTKSIVDDARKMSDRLREQIAGHHEFPDILKEGAAEQSAFAFDGEIWNRARFDWVDTLVPDLIVDYKTTALSFDSWERNTLWGDGGYIQSAHYRKTYKLVHGRPARFVFVVQRTVEPYMIRVIEIDRSFDDEINMQYQQARARFKNCLKTGIWRGEPPYTFHSCPPTWVLGKWEERLLLRDNVEANTQKQEVSYDV